VGSRRSKDLHDGEGLQADLPSFTELL
jgi:hypothetical protein